jgi:hypothetical protein
MESKNKVLRRIFGPGKCEVILMVKIRNEKLCNLYCSDNTLIQSTRMMWVGSVPCIMETRSMCKISFGKSQEKEPIGRHSHEWEYNSVFLV